ncbi:MAG: hypothetical protein KBC64_01675 [Simkaniaceae bacterium]|nr:hypothetical protein [Simkaniaceae bacterium]
MGCCGEGQGCCREESKEDDYEEVWNPLPNLDAWYGWGSPIGLSLAFGICVNSIGMFIFFLHLAGLIGVK